MSAWVLISLWLTGYGYLWPPHSENRSYAFACIQYLHLGSLSINVIFVLSYRRLVPDINSGGKVNSYLHTMHIIVYSTHCYE